MSSKSPPAHPPRARTLVAGTLLALAWLSVMLFNPAISPVYATIIGCRGDPVITLSNGDVIVITTEIASDPEDVQAIHYKLRVPKGVTLVSVDFSGPIGIKEKMAVKDSADQNTYVTETRIKMHDGSNVVATMVTTSWNDQVVQLQGESDDTFKATLTW